MEQPVEFPNAGAAESVGARLKAARESRGLSLGEVADRLKLSLKQLEAIEADRFEALPGATFVRGFVRNYARYLEVDAEPLMKALDAHFPSNVNEVPNLARHEGVESARLAESGDADTPGKKGWLFAGAAVAVAAALVLWFGRSEPVEAPAPAGEELAPMMTEASANHAEAASAPAAAASAPAAVQPAPVVAATPATPAKPVVAPDASAPAAAEGSVRLVASGETWVSVQDATGKRLVYETLQAGTEKTVSGKPPLKVRIGNAPQVQLYYQGQPVPLAGKTRGTTAKLELN
ncbi:helix-turn-helix domain-containing protein [Crenobacter cavernae]|uniref:Helix-turn-helix domain-containing protein n=1 Tax=Crenobacter cavernae TaxID=2290923 RepID=A0ABY0FFW9_9NEIS|nr:RodZ domain-containing protein [Crenobacter cavernae]RXZ45140.1 helix-turn-helix domain-containing protein [Crenobacter cavernae]